MFSIEIKPIFSLEASFWHSSPREDGMGNRYLYDNHTLKTNRSMLGYEKE